MSGRTGCAMFKTDDFWQYAKEAVLSASHTENQEEKHSFLDLARTWIQAALMERRSLVDAIQCALRVEHDLLPRRAGACSGPCLFEG